MLNIQHLTIIHTQDLRPLIRDLSLTLSGTERLAVIGEEGDGKSTLLQAIACPERLEGWAEVSGGVRLAGERLGYLSQETPELEGVTAYGYCAGHDAFMAMDPAGLAELNRLLGLPRELCWSDTPWRQLSGGERVKLRLLTLMAAKPTMLALDEPGNDLDLSALEALEEFLLNCGLPVIYVSHDEHLLRRTATRVLHLESVQRRSEPRWTLANIPYADYVAARAEGLERQEHQWQMERRESRARQERFDRIEQAVAHAQASISRRDPHGGRLLKKKMKAVKSLEHRYEREAESAAERPQVEYRMDAAFEAASAALQPYEVSPEPVESAYGYHVILRLPTTGDETGRAFRDIDLEKKLLKEAHNIGLGAQFGGKYVAHDIRVIRLPRHGASCPIGMGVSCSADRNIKAKINRDGIWLEKMDSNPAELIPAQYAKAGEGKNTIVIDLNQGIDAVRKELTKYPVSTRVNLRGTIIVARDIAHAKLKARIDAGEPMPQYFKDYPVLYAGPAKTPEGYPCGSMGPTTANRMDPYVDEFQSLGASLVMIAKGNRSQQVTDACQKHGGFYLGSIGGVAAVLSQSSIKSIECVEYPELGMEAIWKIEVEDFPAFILVDDKGNDFFKQLKPLCCKN